MQVLWLVLNTSLVHGGRLTSNPERKRGVGVIIITPLLNATPCFAGPLACFRYIVHLWNVENEMNH